MAVSSFASGTQTATVTTEHSLASVNVSGTFRLWVDLVNLATGDVVELRVKGKVLAGGTKRGIEVIAFAGAQPADALIAVSDAYETDLSESDGLEFTLKQTFGTGRNFPWKVRKVG
jgi:hypothetical protein